MLKNVKITLIVLLAVVAAGFYLATTSEVLLFATSRWILLRAIAIGIVYGAVRAVRNGRSLLIKGEVIRHDTGSFIAHWGSGVGIFMLIGSGIMIGFFPSFFEPRPLTELTFVMNLHFVGLVITLFCGFAWATDFILSQKFRMWIPNIRDIIYGTIGKYLLKRPWKYEGKYLSSQKSAFLAFAVLGFVILATGAIKVARYMWPVSTEVHEIVTLIHDVSSVLFILLLIIHVIIVIILGHWLALKSWFSGKMPGKYVKEEHPLWYKEIQSDAQSVQKPYENVEVTKNLKKSGN